MDLVRDVLDNQLVDRNGRNIGRVDGIVLELQPGRAPRVAALEQGSVTLARRLHPALGRWWRALAARVFHVRLRPVRIPPSVIRDIGVDIAVDLDADSDRALLAREKWISRHIIGRIPGGARAKEGS